MPKRVSKDIMDRAYVMVSEEGYTAKQTSTLLKIDDGVMRKRLKNEYGHNFLPDGKKYVNSNYFDTIDSEEKAYWLGFLTADGYVNSKNLIELGLAEIDGSHVLNFKKAIDSTHKICEKISYLNEKTFVSKKISIKDKHMAETLRSYGLTPNKSYDSYIPKEIISNNMIRHYIRGLFDGDGCICIISTNPTIRCTIGLTTASYKMANDYIETVNKNIGVKVKINNKSDQNKAVNLAIHNKKDAMLFLAWIYEDATIYLKRKYNKYIAVLSQKSQET